MKLVVIYGPPGVGKLTVARQLSRITGFKVLHNHLTVDLVFGILDMRHKAFWRSVGRYRLELIRLASREGVKGLIITMVYVKEDEEHMRKIIATVKKHRGSLCFVQLYCDADVLRKRLKEPSRKRYRKLRNVGKLDMLMSRKDLLSPMGFVRTLRIDNTHVSAKSAAEAIKEHYRL
ncbi:MAG: AAA family ATPase [Candidatus Marsarchaeota archaeon]|nr:AAA family ATPase [Candidatus Marsarchaeota archaeon]